MTDARLARHIYERRISWWVSAAVGCGHSATGVQETFAKKNYRVLNDGKGIDHVENGILGVLFPLLGECGFSVEEE